MAIDLTDPVTLRFVERLIALPPAEWDAIGARLRVLSRHHADEPLPPALERTIGALLRVLFFLRPSREALELFGRMLDGNIHRMELAALAPAWRRQGTGPIRHLVEVLERPWVTRFVRSWVHVTLAMIASRAWADDAQFFHVYGPFEPTIPWSSLLPPSLPAPRATSEPGAPPPA